jgi:nucleoside-diphosphate-sugar epimerase
VPAQLRDGLRHVTDLAYDTSRIRRELGYAEAVGYEEGLRRSVAWEEATPGAGFGRVDFEADDAALKLA